MKTHHKPELLTAEPPEEAGLKLAALTLTKKPRKTQAGPSSVVLLGLFEARSHLPKNSKVRETYWTLVECLAEFTGSHSADCARQAAALYRKCPRRNGHCFADGASRKPPRGDSRKGSIFFP